MNLLEAFKSLTNDEKQEFIDLIIEDAKKEVFITSLESIRNALITSDDIRLTEILPFQKKI